MIGIGYKAYVELRQKREGKLISKLEERDAWRPVIYLARATLRDYQTTVQAVGPLKIGKSNLPNVSMRQRNQPGIDFRLLGELLIDGDLSQAEKVVHELLKPYNLIDVYNQGQRELFDIKQENFSKTVDEMVNIINNTRGFKKARVKEILVFEDDQLVIEQVF